MIRKAIVSLAAVLAAVVAFGISTGHTTAARHGPSAAHARAALVRYLRTYNPTVIWPAGLKPGEKQVGAPGHPGAASSGVKKVGSFNWGGYASSSTKAQTYKRVAGNWRVPKVTCTREDRLAAIWVGLDGFSTSTVEQLGTLDWCYKGTAHYYSWYEMFPKGSITVGRTVRPGDAISASVSRTGSKYTLKLTDSTHRANNISHSATCALATCRDESAEWIIERPAFSIGITPLAQIATVRVTNATDTHGATKSVISKSPNADEIEIFDATQAYGLWNPTSLSKTGNSFSGKWLNSY